MKKSILYPLNIYLRAVWCVTLLVWGVVTILAQSYEQMWKQVSLFREQGLPQSALQSVEKIEKKARRDGNKGQALAAFLQSCVLRQEIVPDSFFANVHRMETMKSSSTNLVEQSVIASVLGQVYTQNRYRSQTSNNFIAAHPDSIREWSAMQYDSASVANYLLSMNPILELAREKSARWLPFIQKGKESAYFGGDLLNVVGRRAAEGMLALYALEQDSMLKLADSIRHLMLAEYRRQGSEKAVLFVTLDSIRAHRDYENTYVLVPNEEGQDAEKWVLSSSIYKSYDRLLTNYAHLPEASEVYLEMQELRVSDSLKVQWLLRALERYPTYVRRQALDNCLQLLYRPRLEWQTPAVLYPRKTYELPLVVRNLQSLRVQMFRMSESFSEKEFNGMSEPFTYVKRTGVQIDEFTHKFKTYPPYKDHVDSIRWTAPDIGCYVMVVHPKTDAPLKKTPQPLCVPMFVSRLQLVYQIGGNTEAWGSVVDAETGAPISGACVQWYDGIQGDKELGKTTSDLDGMVSLISLPKRAYITARVSWGEDVYLPMNNGNRTWTGGKTEQKPLKRVHVYTDRAIYRPGQKVQIAGVVYEQNGNDSRVLFNEELKISVYDVQGQELYKTSLKSDEMGTVSAEFVLPKVALTGTYRVSLDNVSAWIRVEEYKRATYQIAIEKNATPYSFGDTLLLKGSVRTLTDVPMRHARVVVNGRWENPIIWRRRGIEQETIYDTIYTDEKGVFELRLPLQWADAVRYGEGSLRFHLETMSPSGETSTLDYSLPVSKTSVHLHANVVSLQNKRKLAPWQFIVESLLGVPQEAEVHYELTAESIVPTSQNKPLKGVVKANQPIEVDTILSALPNGRYSLKSTLYFGKDTLTTSDSFFLFDERDTKLPIDTASWFYCACDSFDEYNPAQIYVGSSSKEVSLYYDLCGVEGLLERKRFEFSDSVLCFNIPYKQEYGTSVKVHFTFVKGERTYQCERNIVKREADKNLRWRWTSFRDKLQPGAQETWTLRIENSDGTPASARLLTVLYDASLERFARHNWVLNPYIYRSLIYTQWGVARPNPYSFGHHKKIYLHQTWPEVPSMTFDSFNLGWLGMPRLYSASPMKRAGLSMVANSAGLGSGTIMRLRGTSTNDGTMVEESTVLHSSAYDEADTQAFTSSKPKQAGDVVLEQDDIENPYNEWPETKGTVRTNFNETAFFYPRLHTDSKGEVSLSFILPESVTTWNFLGVAYTQQMNTANLNTQVIAKKDFMAELHLPRFVREGDRCVLQATLRNQSSVVLKGSARIEVYDPETEKVIFTMKKKFKLVEGQDTVMSWDDFVVTEKYPLLACRVIAQSNDYSDGEQRYLPVLSSREWVTETAVIEADGVGMDTTHLSHLFNKNSSLAEQRILTVEYTSNPMWQAVMALPVLQEQSHDDILSLAAAYYGAVLGGYVGRKMPEMAEFLRQMEQGLTFDMGASFNQLEQNEELKSILLAETPWVMAAKHDRERIKKLSSLFDENQARMQTEVWLDALIRRQRDDGSFGWFPGMRGNEYMTGTVGEMLVRLQKLQSDDEKVMQSVSYTQKDKAILEKLIGYLKKQNSLRVADMKKVEVDKASSKDYPGDAVVQYLYILAHSKVNVTKKEQADRDYLLQRLECCVGNMNREQCARAAVVLSLAGKDEAAQACVASLREYLVQTKKEGTSFAYPSGSFTSTERKLKVHLAAMEALREVTPAATDVYVDMAKWLLLQKRVQAWSTPSISASAVYALWRAGNFLERPIEHDKLVLYYTKKDGRSTKSVEVGDTPQNMGMSFLSGYVKRAFSPSDLQGAPRQITLQKSTNGFSWGAVYAQYLTPISELTVPMSSGLELRCDVSSFMVKVGDKVVQRMVITADKDYEYVSLKVPHCAALEAQTQMSGYGYEGGLMFYRTVRDASTTYFFDKLPKGRYVLERVLYAERAGSCSMGVAVLQGHYAPEFVARTPEQRIMVLPNN